MRLYPHQIDALKTSGVPYRELKPERTAKRAKVKAGRRANLRRRRLARAKGKTNMTLGELLRRAMTDVSIWSPTGRWSQHDPEMQFLKPTIVVLDNLGEAALGASESVRRLRQSLESEMFANLFDEDDAFDPVRDFAMQRAEPFDLSNKMVAESTPNYEDPYRAMAMHTVDLADMERRVMGHYPNMMMAAPYGVEIRNPDPRDGGVVVDDPDGPENEAYFEVNYGDDDDA